MHPSLLKYAAVAIKLSAERALKQAEGPPRPDAGPSLRPAQRGSNRDAFGRPTIPRGSWPEGVPQPDWEQLSLEAALREPMDNLRRNAKQVLRQMHQDARDQLVAPPWSSTETPDLNQRLLHMANLPRLQHQARMDQMGLHPADTTIPRRQFYHTLHRDLTGGKETIRSTASETPPPPPPAEKPKPRTPSTPSLSRTQFGVQPHEAPPAPPAEGAPPPPPAEDDPPPPPAEDAPPPPSAGGWEDYLLPALLSAGGGGGLGYALGGSDDEDDQSSRIRSALLGALLGGGLGVGGTYLYSRLKG